MILALHRRPLLVAFIASALLGCGGSGSSETPMDGGPAQSWTVSLGVPPDAAACLRPGQPLPLDIAIYDSDGQLLPNTNVQLTGDAQSAFEEDGQGGWIIRGEGDFSFGVAYTGDVEEGADLAPASFELISDQTPPEITVSSPARAAMITTNADVRVQAEVHDSISTLGSVTLNEEEQLNASDRQELAIDAAPPGQWGLNTIRIAATDACGNTARHAQSYLRSEEYLEAATQSNAASRVPNGQSLRMAQPVVDDGNRNDLDDLATLIERYLERNLNPPLKQATAGALVYQQDGALCSWITRISISNAGITVGDPNVTSIDLLNGGLRNRLSFHSVQMPIDITARIYNPINCSYTEARYAAFVTLDMAVTVDTLSSVSNGTVRMQTQTPSVTVSNLAVSATGISAIDSLLSSLLDLFQTTISDAIQTELATALPAIADPLLNFLLAGTLSLSGEAYGYELNVVSGIDGQQITPSALTQTAYAQVYPPSAAPPGVDQGSILRPIGPADFAGASEPLTYALNDNLINQGLWALWYGGDLELENLFGLGGVTMRVGAGLPPVLMPGPTDELSTLALGDLQVSLGLTLAEGIVPGVSGELSVDAFVSQYVVGTFNYSAATGQLQLSPDLAQSQTYVQVDSTSLNGEPITDPEQAAAIRDYAERLISGATRMLLNDSLGAIPLPPLTLDFTQTLGGGTITAVELTLLQVRDAPDGIFLDFNVNAQSSPLCGPNDTLSANHRWDDADLMEQGVPYLDGSVDYPQCPSEPYCPDKAQPYEVTVGEYQSQFAACEAAGTYRGAAKCLTSWRLPLAYGWFCGGGRPVLDEDAGDSFWTTPILDPVDFCCKLHDLNLWDQERASTSPLNACGFAMCLHQAATSAPDIFRCMPNVARARISMYNQAAILCTSEGGDTLAPVGDPYVGQLPQ
jgi:hypothetical protein